MKKESGNTIEFDPFTYAMRETRRLESLLGLCVMGVRVTSDLKQDEAEFRCIAEAACREDLPLADRESEVEKAVASLAVAKEEAAAGFPSLFKMAVVRLCSILETMVDDFAVGMLCVHPELRRVEAVAKLKGALVEFIALDHAEQAEYLLEALQHELKTTFKQGVGKFESVLSALALGGAVDESVRRTLLELFETRNAIIHRDGAADARIVKNCPWLGLKLGDPIRVTYTQYNRYSMAAGWYVMDLLGRMNAYHGQPPDQGAIETKKVVSESLAVAERRTGRS